MTATLQQPGESPHAPADGLAERSDPAGGPGGPGDRPGRRADHRIVVLDLYEMGEQLRPTALVVTLEAIQNRVMENRKRGKYTWLCPHRLSISRHQPRLLIFGWLPHERPKPLLARRLLFFSGAEKPNSNLGGLLLQIIQSAC